MIQMRTMCSVADNSGAKKVQCIKVLGGTRRRYARLGDVIVVAVKEATPNAAVKKGDIVEVTAGREKGKRGKVLRVFKEEGRVLVEKLNIVKRHTKARQAGQQGGIIEREGKIHISNVLPVDPKTSKASRVRRKRLEDGRRVRVTQQSGELLDTV